MPKTSGYSLWLVPETGSEAHRVLAQCITDIAKEYGTPSFVPHTTLLGGVDGTEEEMHAKTQELAEKLTPYEIYLGNIGSNGSYFQILFSKIEQTEAVMQANITAQKVFGVDSGTYFPHASLAYGDFSPEQVATLKQKVAERGISEMAFLVQGIELWRCEGDMTDWREVAAFLLKS